MLPALPLRFVQQGHVLAGQVEVDDPVRSRGLGDDDAREDEDHPAICSPSRDSPSQRNANAKAKITSDADTMPAAVAVNRPSVV